MPTYEYACTSCGNHIDVVQGFAEQPLETCEVCGGKLRRVFHPVGVLFKGSGFYSTDSRSKKTKTSDSTKPERAKSSSETKPSDSAKASGTTEKASSEKAS